MHTTAADEPPTCGPRMRARCEDGSPRRALGFVLPRESELQLAGGARTRVALVKATSGKDIEQDEVPARQRIQSYVPRRQHRTTERRELCTTAEADSHRGYLLWKQAQIFTSAEKSSKCKDIQKSRQRSLGAMRVRQGKVPCSDK